MSPMRHALNLVESVLAVICVLACWHLARYGLAVLAGGAR